MEIGQQIIRYRKQQALSQEKLAEKVYVSYQSISNWE
ncbi:TPA: helix-turn-helix transcriptional regulator, partial [Streptococcus pyogenes]